MSLIHKDGCSERGCVPGCPVPANASESSQAAEAFLCGALRGVCERMSGSLMVGLVMQNQPGGFQASLSATQVGRNAAPATFRAAARCLRELADQLERNAERS